MSLLRKRIQLGLIHAAVAMTLVPINSTLNRVMIKEMAISATLVALLASMPYLLSPAQMVIGSYSDRNPWRGWRRSPYIAAGLILCAAGVMLAPHAVFLLPQNWWLGLTLSALTFGAWGMGYNLAGVSYLSLASELSDETQRSRTVAVMWFMMILAIIFTAAGLSRLLIVYSPQTLQRAFEIIGLAALAVGWIGLLGLEPRRREKTTAAKSGERHSWLALSRTVFSIPQARLFFIYLIILLGAILGQDILLEPYGGEAFGLPVYATTRITSIWGAFVLISMAAASWLERRFSKRMVAQISAWIVLAGFAAIASSGLARLTAVFYGGVVLLGIGTGMATVSNLSLMLDMITTRVGLFMGAWGMASALARLLGSVMSGMIRDLATYLLQNPVNGYIVVFSIQGGMMLVSWFLLRRIDFKEFRSQAGQLNLEENAAIILTKSA
ncbi:MAG: BCD family MFS transporter [Anaerolineaceae bacterium]|nr:BCD family MFS transporter [Anaerolineaceae bacterium]